MNVLYADLLQANMNLMNVLRDGSSKYKPQALAAINSSQVTSLWLSLQNCMNKLIDSSTGETYFENPKQSNSEFLLSSLLLISICSRLISESTFVA